MKNVRMILALLNHFISKHRKLILCLQHIAILLVCSLIITAFHASAMEESTVEASFLVGWLAIVRPSVIH